MAIVSGYSRGDGAPAIAARCGISRKGVCLLVRYARSHVLPPATIVVLETGFARYGVPNEILIDYGIRCLYNQTTDTPHYVIGRVL